MRCCQRTKPQSFSVLLQLPAPQLSSMFERCPEMREPLLQHVHSLTPHQVSKAPPVPPHLTVEFAFLLPMLPLHFSCFFFFVSFVHSWPVELLLISFPPCCAFSASSHTSFNNDCSRSRQQRTRTGTRTGTCRTYGGPRCKEHTHTHTHTDCILVYCTV